MGERERLESDLRSRCDATRWEEAAALLVRGYGPELFGFLMVAHRGDEAEAADAFSAMTEAIWRGLPTFAWNSSMRTWAYAIAHRITLTRRRDAARQGRRLLHVSGSSLEQIATRVRTETASFLRTEKRSRLQALRDSLSDEDRMLLLLRVDRELSWNEVAAVLTGEEAAALDERTCMKEASRLRKRYQLVKDRLREMAKREGLLE